LGSKHVGVPLNIFKYIFMYFNKISTVD